MAVYHYQLGFCKTTSFIKPESHWQNVDGMCFVFNFILAHSKKFNFVTLIKMVEITHINPNEDVEESLDIRSLKQFISVWYNT